MARAGADAILLPKVEGSDTVRRALHVLDLAGAPAEPGDLVHDRDAARHPAGRGDRRHRAGAVPGHGHVGSDQGPARAPYARPGCRCWSRSRICLLAARAARISILDGVHLDLADETGFAESCRAGPRSRLRGPDVHPSQADRAGQRGVRAAADRGRRGHAASSRPTTRPGPRARAWSWSTASWSRTCTCWRPGGSWRWPR